MSREEHWERGSTDGVCFVPFWLDFLLSFLKFSSGRFCGDASCGGSFSADVPRFFRGGLDRNLATTTTTTNIIAEAYIARCSAAFYCSFNLSVSLYSYFFALPILKIARWKEMECCGPESLYD
jgi:hypothetical protein